jgi:hypothetical protein
MSKPKKDDEASGAKEKWAHFRFSVIGPLLAAPPEYGRLMVELDHLAGKLWQHPITGHGGNSAALRSSAGTTGRLASQTIRWGCLQERSAKTAAPIRL